MERENDDRSDNKAARNVASALIHEKNPLESPVLCARAAFFRSLLGEATPRGAACARPSLTP